MPTITLHSYRVRATSSPASGALRTPEHALAVYGEGNYEQIAGSEEVREL